MSLEKQAVGSRSIIQTYGGGGEITGSVLTCAPPVRGRKWNSAFGSAHLVREFLPTSSHHMGTAFQNTRTTEPRLHRNDLDGRVQKTALRCTQQNTGIGGRGEGRRVAEQEGVWGEVSPAGVSGIGQWRLCPSLCVCACRGEF